MTGPWDVNFPVRFYANGDTVHEAFNKHIQEIERIYGLLNHLDKNKLETDDLDNALKAHIEAQNPHPNMTLPFSKITGDVPAERVTGDLTNAKISADRVFDTINGIRQDGKWQASRIYGLLSNATIDVDNINNLTTKILNQIVKAQSLNANGYVTFGNGFTIQWGRTETFEGLTGREPKYINMTFPIEFPSACVAVVGMQEMEIMTMDSVLQIKYQSLTKTGFTICFNGTDTDYDSGHTCAYYIAIGY